MFYKLYYWDSTSKCIFVETAALEAIKENPQAVADFKDGKEKALNSLVGAVMKKTKGADVYDYLIFLEGFSSLSTEKGRIW